MSDAREWKSSAEFTAMVVLLLTCGVVRGQDCTFDWAEGFNLPGLDGIVFASVQFDDGSGESLYVGGRFEVAGKELALNIARWDGVKWSAVGTGLNDDVFALIVFDDGDGAAMYAAGSFTSAGGVGVGHIAKWDGTEWSAVGWGIGQAFTSINSMAVFDDGGGPALYAGGSFTLIGGVVANYIAKWDGANWSALGSGLGGSVVRVNSITVYDDGEGSTLFAGGLFTTAGGLGVNNIAKWDGAGWSTLGGGVNEEVSALTILDDGGGTALYAGGGFTTAGVTAANRIARWDGANWSALGAGMDNRVYALTVFDGGSGPSLYAGGIFSAAGGVSAGRIAKWNGVTWSDLGTEMIGQVNAFTIFDDGSGVALYAAGLFTSVGGVGVSNISRWSGASWSALGTGMNKTTRTLALFDDGSGPAIFAGGDFTTVGGVSANRIAKWDGADWSVLDSGMNSQVSALAVFDDGGGPALYAGGFFTSAGGMSANRIAKWDASNWTPLGTGLNGHVWALTDFNDGGGSALYAGGFFTNAGGASANRIAKWDGANWSTLGTGMDDEVLALTQFDDGSGLALYAGGRFTMAGGASVNHIAKWDGVGWSAVGTGTNDDVFVLYVFDDGNGLALYAGGSFTTAGEVSASRIAKWDGTTWSGVGAGVNYHVYAIASSDPIGGPVLYAGGEFSVAGGSNAYRIAKWNGDAWSPLGTGMNETVRALALFDAGAGPALHAGGDFSTAGGNVSGYFGRFDLVTCRIYVDVNATGSNNGSSWGDADTSLQDALSEAAGSSGTVSEIWVAAGTYKPDLGAAVNPGDRTATFQLFDGLTIYGAFAGTETSLDQRDIAAHETTLSGDLLSDDVLVPCANDSPDCDANGERCLESGYCILAGNVSDNSFHVVTGSGTDASATLDGFTITAGNADGTAPSADDRGGGVFIDNGSPTLRNCSILRNTGDFGAGQYNSSTSSPTIANCTFRANSATGSAGAMYNNSSSPTVNNCSFEENDGAAGGGAVLNSASSPTLVACSFDKNSAQEGGALWNGAGSSPVVVNCVFENNASASRGGGIYNENASSPAVTNCLFYANTASDEGGGVYCQTNSNPTLANCTFGGNVAISGGALANFFVSSPTIVNSILWGNVPDEIDNNSPGVDNPTVSSSDVQGGLPSGTIDGGGNIDGDPLFIDAAAGNLRLFVGSPAIDAGDNLSVPLDDADLDGDFDTGEPTPQDLDGNDRFAGQPPVVDMGAYEFIPPIYVDVSATGGNDGSSWADAYLSLQDALTDATGRVRGISGIWVAAGTYTPDVGAGITLGDRTATFQLLTGVSLYGGFAGDELSLDERNIALNETILSGDLSGDDAPVLCTQDSPDCDSFGRLCADGFCIIATNNAENSYHVVTGTGTDATAILDGMTITAGNADGASQYNRGAGMFNYHNSSPTVKNCTFSGNVADVDGGGMHNDTASPMVTNCTFFGNAARYGGAMINYERSPTVIDCTFTSNAAENDGGGMYNWINEPVVVNCTFHDNLAGIWGGGMFNEDFSSPTITTCTFTGNKSGFGGGALFNRNDCNPTVTNCIFSGNSADSIGGGFYNDSSNPTVTNCTLAGNTAGADGGGMYNDWDSSPTLSNCILWSNSDAGGLTESAQIHTDSGTPVVNYSVVQGGWTGAGGTGNSSSDPLFVRDPDDGGDGWGDDSGTPGVDEGANDDYGDLRLLSGSPAIDAGDNDSVPDDIYDLDDDGNTTEPTPFDLDGILRLLDDLLTFDTGSGSAPIVDMGAYEFLRDCNGNGIPDDQELAGNDCQPNNIPDECDIASCEGKCIGTVCVGGPNDGAGCARLTSCIDPACADCDLNGVPDGCETPGLCIISMDSGNWTDDIWGLGAGNYPDNIDSVPDVNVTLDSVTVTLNTDAEIDTLSIIGGATLDVSGGDLTVIGSGGILVDGSRGETGSTLAVGDGQSVDTTSLTIRGDEDGTGLVTADGTAMIDVSGAVSIEGGGEYRAGEPGSSAQLSAGSVTISSGAGDIPGGTMILTDSMGVTTTGDFTMDGTNAGPCDVGGLRIPSGRPPILSVLDHSTLVVGGNMNLLGSTDITIGSAVDVQIGGDLVNQDTSPDCFTWNSGGLTLGAVALGMRSVQVFETAGVDYGPNPDGFAPPGTNNSNYSMGSLEIPTGASVRFVDEFNNDGKGAGYGLEALYVHTLILRAGSDITIDDCKVYYGQLINEGSDNIHVLRSGALSEINGYAAPPLAAAYPHERRKNRYISFDPNKAVNDGENIAFKVELKSINMGSCNDATGGNVDFCRIDRGAADCNSCVGGAGGTCITTPIHCSTGGGTCTPTGATCVNDQPFTGGSNVGQIWWLGPEHPSVNGVHLLVSKSFRKVSTNWPNPTHAGDCEVVPQAVYGVRAVVATPAPDVETESAELLVETTKFTPVPGNDPFWWADAIGALVFHCNGNITEPTCSSPANCGGDPCLRAWTLPNGSVNFDDVNAALTLVAPPGVGVPAEKTWMDLHGGAGDAPPNSIMNSSDLQQFIFGFGGFPYTGFDPKDCPDVGVWPP